MKNQLNEKQNIKELLKNLNKIISDSGNDITNENKIRLILLSAKAELP